MDSIRFRYDLALDQTMMFEEVYPEPLQLDLEEKQELWDTAGSIFVWMFVGVRKLLVSPMASPWQPYIER